MRRTSYVRVWEKAGTSYNCKSSFAAHSSFIYTMIPLEGGLLATGGEDRTVCLLHPGASCASPLPRGHVCVMCVRWFGW